MGMGGLVLGDEGADESWWSLQPISRPEVPVVKNASWVRNPIDAFVLAKLEEKGLQPTPEASEGIIGRRLHFGLTGLPPEPGATADVDALLASSHYGERWARHWLDVVEEMSCGCGFLQCPQPRGIGRRKIDRDVVRYWPCAFEAEEVIIHRVLVRSVLVFSDIKPHAALEGGRGFNISNTFLDPGIIEAHPVNDGLVLRKAKQARGGVSALGSRGNCSDLDKAKTKTSECIDRVTFLIETSGQPKTIREGKTHAPDFLGSREFPSQGLKYAAPVCCPECAQGPVVGPLSLKSKEGLSCKWVSPL